MNTLRPHSTLSYLAVLLLLFSCNRAPKDDGKVPAPLFPQPQTVAANPEGGYLINSVTGDSIHPIVNSFGDTVLTGIPIPVKPRIIHPDSVSKPKSFVVNHAALTTKNAHPNRHKIAENIPTFTVDHSQLKTVKFGEGNQDFVLLNSKGDTIPTGVPIPSIGKMVKTIQPLPIKALPPAIKNATNTHLEYLDVYQGMNSSNVWSILEDRRGNIWFGTFGGGVSRYDGEAFTHYTEKEGLSNDRVISMIEDRSGNLWFGTSGGVVSRYDGATFEHYTEKEGLSNSSVISMIEDRNGNLWFGTNGGGVSRYDGETFEHYTEKEGLSSNRVLSMIEDRRGNLWFGTWGGGVSRYDGATFEHYTEKEGLSNNVVYTILEDHNENLWFGTRGGGVSRYDGATFEHYTEKEGLSNSSVISMIEDRNGNLWFGTDGGGVSRYDGEAFEHYSDKEGLSNNIVRSIIEDRSGNLWFGTDGGGVSRYDIATFEHYTEKEGLSNNRVWSILEDRSGNLWFGTFVGGVSHYDGETFEHYTEKEGLSSVVVESIIEDRRGNLWFGTWGGGVSRYDGETFEHYTEKEGLSNNVVYTIIEDRSGNLWFGTFGGGVSRYDGETFEHYSEKEGLSNNVVYTILEDRSGNLWFGTDGGGVSRYDGETFTHYTEKEGLSNNRVLSKLEDKSGNLFIATSKGLTYFSIVDGDIEKTTFSINVFTKQDGVKGLNFALNSAFIDSKNRAWWGSDMGLTMLELSKFKTSTQIPQPILKQLDINEQFIDYRNISGSLGNEIVFNGVQKFENYPLNLELPYNKNHLTFHYAAIDWAAPNKIQYSYRMLGLIDNWNVPSKEAKVDYRNLSYGTYTFQISAIGESGEWSKPYNYTFTIHPPWWHTWWAYAFYVLFFGSIIFMFDRYKRKKIQRREWHRAQFEKKSMELDHAKEIEKAYFKLEEAHQNLKSTQDQLIQQEKLASLGQLTAGIAHEIKNPLNFVNNFSEVSLEMIDEALDEIRKIEKNEFAEETAEILNDVKSNLQKIHEHGSRADSIVKAMLQHSRGGSGEKLQVKLNPFLKEYVNLAFHGMRAGKNPINVDLVFELDEKVGEILLIAEDFSRVIVNLCSNAFDAMKTGNSVSVGSGVGGYLPKLTVRTKTDKRMVVIEIEDNGPGIPEEILDKILQPFFTTKKGTEGTGLGLSITNDIVIAHGGTIDIKSKQNEFTLFRVTLTQNEIQI